MLFVVSTDLINREKKMFGKMLCFRKMAAKRFLKLSNNVPSARALQPACQQVASRSPCLFNAEILMKSLAVNNSAANRFGKENE